MLSFQKILGYVTFGILYNFYASAQAATVPVDIGPATDAAVFWVNQSVSNQNVPSSFQTWGMVLTAPANATALQTISLYEESSGATDYGISIYGWSSSLQQPVGSALYQSPLIAFGSQTGGTVDPLWGIQSTTFSANVPVSSGNQYIVELTGNGAAGVEIANATPNAQLYLFQSNIGQKFSPFGNDALRSDINFVSNVPLPATVLLFGSALITCVILASVCKIKHRLSSSN